MSELSAKNSRRAGYALHVLTASGAVVGMLALQAIIDNRIRAALLLLIVSQILDGLDGPIARKIDVHLNAPKIDGHILDLVVDYVTCVVVPIIFMLHLHMLPHHYETAIASFMFLTSALWFSRSDLETSDHWFNGFPAVWNLAVPTFLFFSSSQFETAIYCIILAISQLTNFKVPHLVRAKIYRKSTLPFGILYLSILGWMSWSYSDLTGVNSNRFADLVILLFPLYLAVIGLRRTIAGEGVRP